MKSKIEEDVWEELLHAESKFNPFNSAHEGFAVLKEEVDELWDVVKLNPKKIDINEDEAIVNDILYSEDYFLDMQKAKHREMMRAEAVQVAAMAMRFIKGLDNNWSKKPELELNENISLKEEIRSLKEQLNWKDQQLKWKDFKPGT